MKGTLCFHQGWTDIINCLALINYYAKKYEKLEVIMREDAKALVEFYTRHLKNIEFIYKVHNEPFDSYLTLNENSESLFFGVHDHHREDQFRSCWRCIDGCFVKGFYESYNIPYRVRVEYFEFERDYDMEEQAYQTFIKTNGEKYILSHCIDVKNNNIPTINLDKSTNLFFDYIKILSKAQEIHLIDSIWGAICYQLDAKYNIFQHIKVHLYAKRGYHKMFREPVQLVNWKII